jgi:CMP-N,N'-diacetyllegionaminic acid synthase
MVNGKTILALITARGGSKGVPGKNIIDLGGKPLLAWTIQAAKQSKFIDRLIISSDDADIIQVAEKYNCEVPFIRPKELAQDGTSSMDVIIHALDALDKSYDYLLLLQPTSPFRTAQHIDQVIEHLTDTNAVSVVSVSRTKKSPELIFYMKDDGVLQPILQNAQLITRRQDAKPTFEHNGAVYFTKIEYLKQVKSYRTPETTGIELTNFIDVDIDEFDDLVYARYIIEKERHT